MKNGNNNSPQPNLIEYWMKGLLKDGTIIKRKKKPSKEKTSETTKTNKTDDDDEDILIKINKYNIHALKKLIGRIFCFFQKNMAVLLRLALDGSN